jgi:hypothetical protein
MVPPVTCPVTSLSYDDLAEALGIERESARRLVIRKRWKRTKGNDGKARVEVPLDELPARATPPVTAERPRQNLGDVTGLDANAQASDDTGETKAVTASVSGQVTGQVTALPVTEPVTAVLTRHIERLEAEIADLRQRASDKDVVAGQLEALRAVLDEVRGDRDRWHAAATMRRPWWRRLAG